MFALSLLCLVVTAMHQAALYGQAEVIEFLKSCGGLVSATDYHSSTPLHVSCQKGHQSAVVRSSDSILANVYIFVFRHCFI